MRKPRYTSEEDQYIIENYGKIPAKEVVAHLGRPFVGLKAKAKRLGLERYYKNYTSEDDQYIREHFGIVTYKEMAAHLNHPSAASIQRRATRLGLTELRAPLRKVDKKELTRLTIDEGLGTCEVARRMRHTSRTIIKWKKRLGLPNNWSERTRLGKDTEDQAEDYFNSRGMKIIERGNFNSPFDWIVKDGEEILAVNVKAGKRYIVGSRNIPALRAYGVPVFLCAEHVNGKVTKWHLLRLVDTWRKDCDDIDVEASLGDNFIRKGVFNI